MCVLIAFLLITLAIIYGHNILENEKKFIKAKLTKTEKERSGPLTALENTKKEKLYLEEKLTGLTKLYAVTREMSFNIRFKGLFDALKNFLEDNFKFEKFQVFLFAYENGKKAVSEVCEIGRDSAGYVKPDKVFCGIALSVAESGKPVFLESAEDLFNFELDASVRNLLAVPLVARRKVIAAILAENTEKSDYDKFLILAPQVALQIERISLFDEVERLSITDGLTGIFLRRHFLEKFKEEIFRAQGYRTNLSFIMVDLDFFKRCNDSFGHLVGDVVLKEVAHVVKTRVREIDLVARYGGEEFCVLLPETGKAAARAVAERIRKEIENTAIKAYDESIRITVSMGVSAFPEDADTPDGLIEKADKALYEAKAKGRNCVSLA